ncbi:hypothetical protein [Ornithinimicrobium cerasi]|uniref:Helicase n=1 Tax=Ornithinimicrobium cerasi TaxID=2248773 RepID=A0A285VSZ0_9MICO|nr:hypothetical protein [Ornithinimicrobium cerasi]SOC57162.1 hypothetical protein SAMN05421879_11112 [Ornithinimicrobium cerasi]
MTNVWGLEGQTVRVGGQPRSSLVQSLRQVGVQLNDHAKTLLAHPAFEDPESQDLQFVVRTVHQLGLPTGGTQSQVFVAARRHGFQLCPVISGPFLRLATMDQPSAPDSVLSAGRAPTGAIHVASEPLSADAAYPKGFYLRVVDDEVWLRGFRCDDTYEWGPQQRLALVEP